MQVGTHFSATGQKPYLHTLIGLNSDKEVSHRSTTDKGLMLTVFQSFARFGFHSSSLWYPASFLQGKKDHFERKMCQFQWPEVCEVGDVQLD